MARSFPQAPTGDYGAAPPAGDWQALRGELVALLDQVEGQYARSAPGLPALAGFAERMRDLRFQVADGDPGDRRREALRSVSRQLERFNERGEPVPAIAHADNVLQSAIQQIRARTQPPQTAPAPPRASEYTPQPVAMPPTAPRFDDLAMAMAGLTGRLGQLETELKAQRSNGGEQMREIADQVAQLSQVVELVAGAVGETGQVKRLEGQIAGLAQLMGQTPKLDIATFTERLDVVAATVDRLADLQVQQIRHTVREAETAPDKDAIATRSLQTIEASVRNIYDRIDGLESSGVRLADLEGVTDALAQISMRLDAGADKRDSLLSLVDALNGRVNEIEYKSDAVSNLRGDIEGLRDAVLNGLEPRFLAIESQLGDLGERVASRAGEAPNGLSQLEAQVRQLVARMDQTGEQLAELARLYSAPAPAPLVPDFEGLASLTAARTFEAMRRNAPADFDAIAERAAMRTYEQMEQHVAPMAAPDYDGIAGRAAMLAYEMATREAKVPTADFENLAERAAVRTAEHMVSRQPETTPPDYDRVAERAAMLAFEKMQHSQLEVPDFEALANLAAARTSHAMSSTISPPQELSAGSLVAIEERLTRLVEAITRARSSGSVTVMQDGIGRVEARLARLETSISRRDERPLPPVAMPATPAAISTSAAVAIPAAMAEIAAAMADDEAAVPAPRAFGKMPKPNLLPPAEPMPPADSAPIAPVSGPQDNMPRSPATDAPLTEFGFPDLTRLAAALEARNGSRKQHAGMENPQDGEAAARFPLPVPAPVAMVPAFDPATAARPPRPVSSLAHESEQVFIDAPISDSTDAPPASAVATPEVSQSSRNTFIEAARRAAQRQTPASTPPESSSVIGRALSRFQPSTSTASATSAASAEATYDLAPVRDAKPTRAEKAAAKQAETARARASRGLSRRPAADQPTLSMGSGTGLDVQSVSDAGDGSAVLKADARRENFLLRHRRGILLAASVIAISFLAVNLVMQRLDASVASADTVGTPPVTPSATAPTSAVPTATPKPVSQIVRPASEPVLQQTAAAAPNVPASMTDPTVTASIDPTEAMSFAPASSASMPPALAAANAAAQPTAAPLDATAPTVASVSTEPAVMDSPVKVDLPPDGVGPAELRQAAADGDARAQFEVAAIYSEGRAITQDYKAAAVWYERAGAQGFAPAEYRLGNLYENGNGVAKDLEQARLWYQRSAEAGNRMAMHNLAALYAGGQFGKQDFASAAEWFQHAADLGMKDSQFNLGMLYARGLGVPQNLQTSYKWFALAASTGDTEATKARDDMGRQLDAASLKRATDTVSTWKVGQVDLAANFAPIGTWSKTFDPGATIANKDIVAKVQVALTRLGFDIGAADGHLGNKTTAAIKAFEGGTGMSVVGAINPRLLAVLGSQPV